MSAQVLHDSRPAASPRLEIETLRTLVQNLETQNAALRAKGLVASSTVAAPGAAIATPHAVASAGSGKLALSPPSDMVAGEQQHPSTGGGMASPLDTVQLLDVEGDTSLDEEASWLYVSPSKYAGTCITSSPEKWMRQDFDEPTANSRLARRSLYFTLDDVINECNTPKSAAAAGSSNTLAAGHKETSGNGTGGVHSSFAGANTAGPIPSATAGSSDTDRSPPNAMAVDRPGLLPTERSPPGAAAANRHSLEPTAVRQQPSSSRSTEMLDIQAMARLQEQSLRESFNSLRRASGSSSGSIPQLNLSDLDSSTGSSISGSARHLTPDGTNMLRGSMDTYRVEKGAVVNGNAVAVQQSTALPKAASSVPQSQTGGGTRAASPPDLGSGSSSSSSSTSGGSPLPASAAVRRSLPVPTRISMAATAVPPRSREPSPAGACQSPTTAATSATATTVSARSALPQPSSLPRASNLPTPGSRRSGLPTPRSAVAAFTRPVD